jgi:hypothetical protein
MPQTEISTVRRSLAPTTYTEAFEFAQHLAKSSMVPSEYRGKPENILLAMQWGMEVGLAPLQAIQNIAVINGKPSVYGDALLAMVKGSPVCDDVIESFEGTGDTLTAVCDARRKGKAPAVARFSVADAKKAGLWNKTGPWQQYPRRMLQMRARGFASRTRVFLAPRIHVAARGQDSACARRRRRNAPARVMSHRCRNQIRVAPSLRRERRHHHPLSRPGCVPDPRGCWSSRRCRCSFANPLERAARWSCRGLPHQLPLAARRSARPHRGASRGIADRPK